MRRRCRSQSPPRNRPNVSIATLGQSLLAVEVVAEGEAVAVVVNGFCKEVLQALPMEFAMEAQALVAISLEGSVG